MGKRRPLAEPGLTRALGRLFRLKSGVMLVLGGEDRTPTALRLSPNAFAHHACGVHPVAWAQTIRNWVEQAGRDHGTRRDGLTSAESAEMAHLRREVRRLKLERDSLPRAAAWLARETGTIPSSSNGASGS